MTNFCEWCETALETDGSITPCVECGTACCRSCAVEIETQTYCPRCATSMVALI